MRLLKMIKLKKLLKDPFVVLIAIVVLVPSLLIGVGIATQNHTQSSAVNSAANETSPQTEDQTSADSSQSQGDPQPITDAEQPPVAEKKPVSPPSAAALAPSASAPPVCDEGRKQAAHAARDSRQAQENSYHAQQQDRLRLISVVYRKYWDDEVARHQAVLAQINADFQAALAAANC